MGVEWDDLYLPPINLWNVPRMNDPVNRPKHYTEHPSGVECIQITEHMGFNLGNAIKYIWRADLKNDALEDLKKAEWYIRREISKRSYGQTTMEYVKLQEVMATWAAMKEQDV